MYDPPDPRTFATAESPLSAETVTSAVGGPVRTSVYELSADAFIPSEPRDTVTPSPAETTMSTVSTSAPL